MYSPNLDIHPYIHYPSIQQGGWNLSPAILPLMYIRCVCVASPFRCSCGADRFQFESVCVLILDMCMVRLQSLQLLR